MALSIRRYVAAGAVAITLGLSSSARAQVEPPPVPPLPQVPQLAPGGHVTSPVCGDIAVAAALAAVVLPDLPIDNVAQVVNAVCQVFPPPAEPLTCSATDPLDAETESIPANIDVMGWLAGALVTALEPTGAGEDVVGPLGCGPTLAPGDSPALPEEPPPPEAPPARDGIGSLVASPLDMPITPDAFALTEGAPSGDDTAAAGTPSAAGPTAVAPGRFGNTLPAAASKKEEWTAARFLGLLMVPLLVAGGVAASAWARRSPF